MGTEHIIHCIKSERTLCPVTALFTYAAQTPSITKTDSVFLSVTKQTDAGVRCYVLLTAADRLAKDTKDIMDAAGIDQKYSAHALRGSTASKLSEQGVAELNMYCTSPRTLVRYFHFQEVLREGKAQASF